MRSTIRIAALALVLAALAVLPAGTELRAHETGFAYLSALTVTAGGTALTLSPAFSNTVEQYTVLAADAVSQITIEATPDADATPDHNATLVYQDRFGAELTDAATTTDGLQVNIPAGDGGKRMNVAVRHVEPSPGGGSGTLIRKKVYSVRVVRAGTQATERAALMALYNSTDGANWTTNTNWGSTEPISTWHGVSTGANGTRLLLFGKNLVGTIPDALSNFTDLGSLSLGNNQLSGAAPSSLGNLTNLTDLRLLNNQLTGNLAWLSRLTHLQHLYLSSSANTPGNQFTGNLTWLSSLTQLVYLEVSGNQLTGSIPGLSSHTNLQYLYLNDNQLSGAIPSSLGSLTGLFYLFLNNNQLSGSIPSSLGSLTALQQLSLHHNQLTGSIPDSLGSLTGLWYVYLQDNQLTGSIPDLSRLTAMQYLDLRDNQLSGTIPATLGSATNLYYLLLSGNKLSGTIPSTLGSLRNLWYLYLHDNLLTETIPSSLSNLTNLYILTLSQNELSGTIPSLGSSFTNLQELSLWSNQLTGSIPASLGDLPNLTHLFLNHNQLTGSIPTSLGNLTGLQKLSLSSNQLTGSIPTSLGNLTFLAELSLWGNDLTGSIPNLGRLSDLLELKLQENQLTGTIPATLGNLTALRELSLWGNQLTGEIPASLGSSANDLQELYLHKNQLSGTIPALLGSLPGLRITRFAGNTDSEGNPSLTGCVPVELRFLVTADEFAEGVPAHDFIALDANSDGDTEDEGDIPGLHLPFCLLSGLTLSDVTLGFAKGTAAYTADVASTVESTTVTATLDADAKSSDRLSIKKGTTSYTSGAAVPLAVGSNEITITVTPTDGTPTLTYSVTVFREGVDRATLMVLYNSLGGASWTDKTNWGETGVAIGTWYGVTTNANGRVTDLDLSSNNLRGTLPTDTGTLTNLITLDLSDNSLSGTIPELSALTQLQNLYLGDNQLSGAIPDWLGSLTGLQDLSLRDNRLTGPIPEELGDLTDLDALYLDNNRLTGTIPAELGSLSGLDVTRFAGNALTGCVPDGFRYLVASLGFASLPAQDFIPVDANDDGDTDDDGDTPGLGLPFCTLRSLTLSGVTLDPVFASDTVVYTASADHAVTSPTITATAYSNNDSISIMKGADTYMSGGSVPLAVGPNVITIEITPPPDTTPAHTYTVTVTRAPNTPPAFGEGPTTTRGVDENTVAGTDIGESIAATDTENDTLTYSLDATGAESFDIDASSGQLQTKVALDFEDKSSYTVTVSVRDSKNDNGDADEVTDDTITVTILVADLNEDPEFPISETGMRSVDENTIAGENIGAPVAATDGDNDTLTYSLDVSSRATFDIVATTGQLQTKAALDYETGSNSYTVTVTAADPSAADDAISVTITINNVDEAGTVTLSSPQPIVGQEVTATLTDPDGSPTDITWFWHRSRNRNAWISIKSITNAGATYDYLAEEDDLDYYLRATASYTDRFGADKSASLISVQQVAPAPVGLNTPPVFTPIQSDLHDVDENTPAGMNIGPPVTATDAEDDTLTYSLDATSLAFDIVSTTGQLRTKAALNFIATAYYSVTVTATDTAGGTDTITITIYVNNVDEAGTVTLSSLQPLVAIPLTATLDDPDGISGSVTWSWARSPNGASSWTLISGASDSYTPAASDVGDYLRATASYNDGQGGGKSAQTISANAVEVAPGRNKPVLREYPTATRSVTRNTPAGRNIGAPLSATDADNDALTYRLGGPDEASFDIDASSGQLLTRAELTGIQRTSYKVFVSVSDGKDDLGNTEANPQIDATTEVTISVATPRSSGGGSGGFSAGPGEVQLVIAAAVAGEDVPAGQRFGFAFDCTPPDGPPADTWAFSVGAGQASGRFVPGNIPCSLTVTDAGGADAVDGLFTNRVLGEENLRVVVTFTYGIVTTAVPLDAKTVVEEAGVSLTIPEGSRDAPYAVLLETAGENCDGALGIEGEVIACFTVTVFDSEGAEETDVTLLVPATITIAIDAARVAELGGIAGVRAARQRGELRMLQRDDAESPWGELPFTVEENTDGGVEIVVSVQAFSDFSLITSTPRTQTVALHSDWNVVVWDGADGASIPDALGDIAGQVDVIYQWLAETQTWRSHRPAGPPILSAFDTFTRGATYWIRSSEAVEWTVVGGPLEPPAAEPTRLHSGWTEVVWRGADGADIAEALGADVLPQVEVIYRWVAEAQLWARFRPGGPAFLNAFDTFATGGSYWIAVAEGVEWAVGPDGG